mmetsp:Transcript_8369/g.19571  ORF Transcript_8369/g.19571 Transcript_8369/m.19571 type:complete len:255 (-) Transcript_8369:152-916(-)
MNSSGSSPLFSRLAITSALTCARPFADRLKSSLISSRDAPPQCRASIEMTPVRSLPREQKKTMGRLLLSHINSSTALTCSPHDDRRNLLWPWSPCRERLLLYSCRVSGLGCWNPITAGSLDISWGFSQKGALRSTHRMIRLVVYSGTLYSTTPSSASSPLRTAASLEGYSSFPPCLTRTTESQSMVGRGSPCLSSAVRRSTRERTPSFDLMAPLSSGGHLVGQDARMIGDPSLNLRRLGNPGTASRGDIAVLAA